MAQDPPKQPTRTQQPQAAQEQARETREETREPAFLVGRCRAGAGFSRGGIRFTPKWQAFELAQFPAEIDDGYGKVERLDQRLRRILVEPMLDARLATTAEVEGMADLVQRASDQHTTREELATAFEGAMHRIARLEARLAEMEQRAKGDHPPRRVEDLPGYRVQIPNG